MKYHSRMGRTIWLFGVILGFILFQVPVSATEYSRATLLFLVFSPSARINGLGGAGVAIPDEPLGYYNPAAAALCTKEHFLYRAAYTEKTKWLPILDDDLRYSYSGTQIGINLAPLRHQRDFSVGFSVGQYTTKFDLGTRTRTNEAGVVIGSFSEWEKAVNTVVGASVHLSVDLSVGITFIDYESHLLYGEEDILTKGKAKNYGFMLHLPRLEFSQQVSRANTKKPSCIKPFLEFTGGTSWNNRGNDVHYISSYQKDPLPRNRKTGYSIETGIALTNSGVSIDLIRVLATSEEEKTQIKPSEGVTKSDITDKKGIELELLEILAIRKGTFDDSPGQLHFKTSGWTIKSDGLAKLLCSLIAKNGETREQKVLDFIGRHISISLHKSEEKEGMRDGTEYTQINISF